MFTMNNFIELTSAVSGKKFSLNMHYIDECAPHESGKGTMFWSSKPGVKGYHAAESYDDVRAIIMFGQPQEYKKT